MSKNRTPCSNAAVKVNDLGAEEPLAFRPVAVPPIKSLKSENSTPKQISDTDTRNMLLNAEVSRLNQRIQELENSTDIDPLVDVFTQPAFMRELERARAMNARYDIPSAIIVFHLTNLNGIIDQYGPVLGDDLLLKVREVFRTDVRNCDTVARLSSDEFSVILFKTEFDVARKKSRMLAEKISQAGVVQRKETINVTLTWGVAPCDSDQTPQQILARANRAKSS